MVRARKKLLIAVILVLSSLGALLYCTSAWRREPHFAELDDPDPHVRAEFILGLRARGQAHLAIPAIIACLDDPSPEVRTQAIHALNNVGSAAIPALQRVLRTGGVRPRHSALLACGLPDPRIRRGFSA